MALDNIDLDRYSISKIDDTTFMLTDADTLQTWEIEILQNKCQEVVAEQEDEKTSPSDS